MRTASWARAALAATVAGLPEPVVLLGGMDSHAVLFACVEAGLAPQVVTCRTERPSPDADQAQATARRLGLTCTTLVWPAGRRACWPVGPPLTRNAWPILWCMDTCGPATYLTGSGSSDDRRADSLGELGARIDAYDRWAAERGSRLVAPLMASGVSDWLPRPDRWGKPTLRGLYRAQFNATYGVGRAPAASPMLRRPGLLDVELHPRARRALAASG